MSTIAKEHVYPSSFKRIEPQPGQESVWDYPKPPSYHPVSNNIRIPNCLSQFLFLIGNCNNFLFVKYVQTHYDSNSDLRFFNEF